MKLRKWVQMLIAAIMLLCFFVMGANCESLALFIWSKIIALGIFYLGFVILRKYGNLGDDENE